MTWLDGQLPDCVHVIYPYNVTKTHSNVPDSHCYAFFVPLKGNDLWKKTDDTVKTEIYQVSFVEIEE